MSTNDKVIGIFALFLILYLVFRNKTVLAASAPATIQSALDTGQLSNFISSKQLMQDANTSSYDTSGTYGGNPDPCHSATSFCASN